MFYMKNKRFICSLDDRIQKKILNIFSEFIYVFFLIFDANIGKKSIYTFFYMNFQFSSQSASKIRDFLTIIVCQIKKK